jgi:hypothetical protein
VLPDVPDPVSVEPVVPVSVEPAAGVPQADKSITTITITNQRFMELLLATNKLCELQAGGGSAIRVG